MITSPATLQRLMLAANCRRRAIILFEEQQFCKTSLGEQLRHAGIDVLFYLAEEPTIDEVVLYLLFCAECLINERKG